MYTVYNPFTIFIRFLTQTLSQLRRRLSENRTFKMKWKDKYLRDFEENGPKMTCMICWQSFDCSGSSGPKLDTVP